jgi:hypothetical protein
MVSRLRCGLINGSRDPTHNTCSVIDQMWRYRKLVSCCFRGGAGWDVEKLHNSFFEADVEDIMKIPVGRAGTVDYLAWNYTKNGNFSVKSAYHLRNQVIKAKEGAPPSSSSCDEHKGWLALWAADVPGKVKIHTWRLARNGLAIGDELQRRKIKEGVKCIVCNRVETLKHRFWECLHAARVWELIRETDRLPTELAT